MTVRDIYNYLDELAAFKTQMDFDNSGLMLGSMGSEVTRCLVALDVTDAVIDEALELGAELIVSHHPLIFYPLKSLQPDEPLGRKIYKLVKNDISVISAHTNLDVAEGGVNDALMAALSCSVQSGLEPSGDAFCGRVGEYEEAISFEGFLEMCREKLNCKGLRYHKAGDTVKKLGVMGGAGSHALALAYELGCDTYLSSDIKYNSFLDAEDLGINLIDADHFCTENVIVPVLCRKLGERFPQISFCSSKKHCQTANFY